MLTNKKKELDGLLKLFNQRHVAENWTIFIEYYLHSFLGGSKVSLIKYIENTRIKEIKIKPEII